MNKKDKLKLAYAENLLSSIKQNESNSAMGLDKVKNDVEKELNKLKNKKNNENKPKKDK